MQKYIIDLKETDNIRKYYALKGRFGETIEDEVTFKESIVKEIKKIVLNYDLILIPESSSTFIEDIIKQTGKKYLIINKRNKKEMLEITLNMKLQKKEKESHIKRFEDMGESFKINKLKASQRKKYIPYLFVEKIIDNKRSVIIDDSCFTGTTFEALKFATKIEDAIFIFSK